MDNIDNMVKSVNGQMEKIKKEICLLIDQAKILSDLVPIRDYVYKLEKDNPAFSNICSEVLEYEKNKRFHIIAESSKKEQQKSEVPRADNEEELRKKIQDHCKNWMLNAKSWDELKITTEYMHMFDKGSMKISTPELLEIERQMNAKLKNTMTNYSLYDENGKIKKFKKIDMKSKEEDKKEYDEFNEIFKTFCNNVIILEDQVKKRVTDECSIFYDQLNRDASNLAVKVEQLRGVMNQEEYDELYNKATEYVLRLKNCGATIEFAKELVDSFQL